MRRRFLTADVFTDRMFGGNPVAVVLDATGLAAERMQALATEFNYSETTFVLPPSDPAHTAHVRIFTPAREVPFAGHPNIGTAFVLARQAVAQGRPVPERLVFEEAAGLVAVDLLLEAGMVVGAELTSPQTLSRLSTAPVAERRCLPRARRGRHPHGPARAAGHLGGAAVPGGRTGVAGRLAPGADEAGRVWRRAAAGRRGRDLRLHARRGRGDGRAVPHVHAAADDRRPGDWQCHGRDDGAAGRAARRAGDTALRVGQGVDMGRGSLLLSRAKRRDGGIAAYVGGRCVPMFEG